MCFYNRVNFRLAEYILASAVRTHPIVECVTVCLLPTVTQALRGADSTPPPAPARPRGSLEVQVHRGLDVLMHTVVETYRLGGA